MTQRKLECPACGQGAIVNAALTCAQSAHAPVIHITAGQPLRRLSQWVFLGLEGRGAQLTALADAQHLALGPSGIAEGERAYTLWRGALAELS